MEPILKENHMKIIGRKEGDSYVFYEDHRKIYTITSKIKKGFMMVPLLDKALYASAIFNVVTIISP